MLRNVVERVFGVLKKRFGILSNMQSFSFPFQVKLVLICFMLHNFIRITETYEDRFWAEADRDIEREKVNNLVGNRRGDGSVSDSDSDNDDDNVEAGPGENASAANLKKWRDDIAKEMWVDYLKYISRQ